MGLEKKQKTFPAQASEAMTKTSKRELEIGNTSAPAAPPSSLFKKETVSNTLTAAFQFRLHKWDEVRGGVAGVAANSIRSFFWLCFTVPLILNSKCGHLKNPKSFIHWSDCETCRW